jgi:hypothetical protein
MLELLAFFVCAQAEPESTKTVDEVTEAAVVVATAAAGEE